jgi:hypothetical protein
VRDVRREWRQTRHDASDVPAVQRPRRGAVDPADDARPDDQRHYVPPLPRRGADHRGAMRDVPGRWPRRVAADAPGEYPAGYRRGPSDQAVERGRGRAARWAAGEPLRRRPCRPPSRLAARGHRAHLRGRHLRGAGRAGHADRRPDRRRRRGGRDQARDTAGHGAPAAGQGRPALAAGRFARRPARLRQRDRADEAEQAGA